MLGLKSIFQQWIQSDLKDAVHMILCSVYKRLAYKTGITITHYAPPLGKYMQCKNGINCKSVCHEKSILQLSKAST